MKTYNILGRTVEVTDMKNGTYCFETNRSEGGYVTKRSYKQAVIKIEEMLQRIDDRRAEEEDEIAESLGES